MRGTGIDTPRLQNFFSLLRKKKRREDEKIFASSGNRTRAARVAGEHSTTEPTMPGDMSVQQTVPYESFWGRMKQNISAVGRIRTYAPRGKLISSQSP